MRAASEALIALLDGGAEFMMADLYTFTLADGSVFRYTSADTPLALDGDTFEIGPLILRDKVRLVTGLEVDELSLTFHCDATTTVPGRDVGLVRFAAQGGLDGATLSLQRVFMPSWGDTSPGAIVLFAGAVSGVACSRWEIRLKVRSFLELLDVQIPRMTYQAGCRNTLFDAEVPDGVGDTDGYTGCTLKRGEFQVSGRVTGTLNQWIFHDLQQETGYFDLGIMTMTSGANEGVSRTVKRYTNAGSGAEPGISITLMGRFPAAVAPGDTFEMVPGCDKTLATCQTKFNTPVRDLTGLGTEWRAVAWRKRFSGEPFIPAPESVT